MKINFQTISDQGAVRPNNEDSIKCGVLDDIVWMVIADGMGGHLAGEVASSMLVEEIEKALPKLLDINADDYRCFIELEINRANNKIYSRSEKEVEKKGMGTTAVMLIIENNHCYLGWVGDSRCYHFKGNSSGDRELKLKTTDHTMVQALYAKGAISKQEVETSTQKNMLTRAVGIKKGVKVDTLDFPVGTEDLLFLSTDGLHDSIGELDLLETIDKIGQDIDMTEALVKKAIENGSKDNITFGSICIK